MVLCSTNADSTVITLLPNRSATWQETRLVLFLICGTTLAIGTLWAVAGAWAVLPFSGIEAALVAYVLYRVSQATYQRQVITVAPHSVLVQAGTHFPKRSWSLERARTHFAVSDAPHPLAPVGLRIVDGVHSIELGRFLNREDKTEALAALRRAGLQMRSSNPDGAFEP
ncbi:MAG: hypothetical protein RLZZ227_2738 [Pseudomonadota bacterium]|jgi:uncharacterized membrane protein